MAGTTETKQQLQGVVRELKDRANSRQRPSDPVSLEAVQVLALACVAEALADLLVTLGPATTPRASAARTALRNLARTHPSHL